MRSPGNILGEERQKRIILSFSNGFNDLQIHLHPKGNLPRERPSLWLK